MTRTLSLWILDTKTHTTIKGIRYDLKNNYYGCNQEDTKHYGVVTSKCINTKTDAIVLNN